MNDKQKLIELEKTVKLLAHQTSDLIKVFKIQQISVDVINNKINHLTNQGD